MRFSLIAASLLLIVPSIDAADVSPAKRALIEEVIRVSNPTSSARQCSWT